MKTPDTLWMHYHIPKTGGTSFGTHLRSMTQGDGRYLSVTMEEQIGSLTHEQIVNEPTEALSSVEIVQGHGVGRYLNSIMPRKTVREIFVIRDPAQRLVSNYNFRYRSYPRGKAPTFADYLAQISPNFSLYFLCRSFGYRIDKYALDRVLMDLATGYTFTLERLDEAGPLVCGAMGYSNSSLPKLNVSGKDHPKLLSLTPELSNALRRMNPLDQELYSAAKHFEDAAIMRLHKLQPGSANVKSD